MNIKYFSSKFYSVCISDFPGFGILLLLDPTFTNNIDVYTQSV